MNSNISQKLIKIAKKYNLDLLVSFGSRARKTTNKDSDYDLAYLKYNQLSIKEEFNLHNDLIELFEDVPFDLINLSKPHIPLLGYKIFSEGVCLYEKKKGIFQKCKENSYFEHIDAKELLYKTRNKLIENIT